MVNVLPIQMRRVAILQQVDNGKHLDRLKTQFEGHRIHMMIGLVILVVTQFWLWVGA